LELRERDKTGDQHNGQYASEVGESARAEARTDASGDFVAGDCVAGGGAERERNGAAAWDFPAEFAPHFGGGAAGYAEDGGAAWGILWQRGGGLAEYADVARCVARAAGVAAGEAAHDGGGAAQVARGGAACRGAGLRGRKAACSAPLGGGWRRAKGRARFRGGAAPRPKARRSAPKEEADS